MYYAFGIKVFPFNEITLNTMSTINIIKKNKVVKIPFFFLQLYFFQCIRTPILLNSSMDNFSFKSYQIIKRPLLLDFFSFKFYNKLICSLCFMASLSLSNFINYYFIALSIFSGYFFVLKSNVKCTFLNNFTKLKKGAASVATFSNMLILHTLIIISVFVSCNSPFMGIFVVMSILSLLSFFLILLTKKKNPDYASLELLVPLILPVYTLLLLRSPTYLHFLFYIELIGYTFYFQFQTTVNKIKQAVFIDMLLQYYWSNFFGTILLFLVLYRLFYIFGTSDFKQLKFFTKAVGFDLQTTLFLFFGICLKIGAPGFHMLKSELYKYAATSSILNFSVLSTTLFIYTYYFLGTKLPMFASAFDLVHLLLLMGALTFLFAIKHINNIVLFFGYSAIITSSTILLIYI